MESEKKGMDLDDDQELEALRMAALATLKSRAAKKSEFESPENDANSVATGAITYTPTSIPYSRKEKVSCTLHNNQYAFRNSTHPPRRGRGRGTFPKVNQRSNLIVITPVSTSDKNSVEKSSAPQLKLPQHKWCQSVNDESSSPKTYSKRGPTRFNRHESGSDSSDSDYDNSDHDSYSNETILQDEHSGHFTRLTPEESVESEAPGKIQRSSDRRLSFQNIDSNLDNLQQSEDENVHDSKVTCLHNSIDDKAEVLSPKKDFGKAWNWDLKNDTSYDQYNHASSVPFKSQTISSIVVNGDLRMEMDCDKISQKQSITLRDNISDNDSHFVKSVESYTDDPKLTQNDLRIELKKRLQKLRSDNSNLPNTESKSQDQKLCDQRQISDDVQHRFSQDRDRDRTHNHSKTYGTGERQVRNHTHNNNRQHSTSPNNRNWEHRQSLEKDQKRADRNSKRDYSRSPGRRNQGSTRSPNRNGKHSCSRSPVKRYRQLSGSPDRYHKRSLTTRSPEKTNNKSSRSPNKSRKRSVTQSPELNFKHDNQSPHKSHHRSVTRSPERNRRQNCSRSPVRNHKRSLTRSPEPKRKRNCSRSPVRSRKCVTSWSPVRNQVQTKRDYSRSPVQIQKHNSSCSPEGKQAQTKQEYSQSPVRSQKRKASHSPERKPARTKRDYSRSPVRIRKYGSSRSLEKKQCRKKDRRRRSHRSYSRSSSTLSSSSSSTSSSSSSSSPCIRSISSVIKPVQSTDLKVQTSISSNEKLRFSSDSDFFSSVKRGKDLDEKPKVLSSLKSSIVFGENRNNASEGVKRLPVHMRLGSLPRNKLIRMTKDVEAAFVNSSSEEDEGLGREGKKQNFRVVTEVHTNKSDILKRHVEKSTAKGSSASEEKSRRKKAYR